MNILSNILKIDYTLYIINDKKIKQEIINKIFDDDVFIKNKLFYNKITIIKYNNIYYLHYLNVSSFIYLYDNI
jgi:hypothetical protein